MNNFKADYYRNTGKKWSFLRGVANLIFRKSLRYLFLLRLAQKSKNKLFQQIVNFFRWRISVSSGIEIHPETSIGPGLRLVHPYNIAINPNAIIGKNVNIYKGSTIGFALGKNKGVPVIGDDVQIGINACLIGNITIGDDVLIAPNAFVNIDVPSHSVVIGNPAKIISKEEATKGYVDFKV